MPQIDTKKYRENFEKMENPLKEHWTDGVKPVEYFDLPRWLEYPDRDNYRSGYDRINWYKD